MQYNVNFRLDRETKGALRYQEIGPDGKDRTGDADGAFICTLYLRKAALDGDKPASITITIDDGESALKRVA
jgi:hypothetical protein